MSGPSVAVSGRAACIFQPLFAPAGALAWVVGVWGIRPRSSSGPCPGSMRAYPGKADPPGMRAVP